jgi:transcriptional regulator with XRE-family HTH domain
MSIVSDNIKYLRKVNGLTQEEFARRIGIKRSLLGAYEEARANPNLSNLMNIAKIFGTSVDDLIKNDMRKSGDDQRANFTQSAPSLLMPEEAPAKEVRPSKSVPPIVEKYYRESKPGKTESVPDSVTTALAPPFVNKSYAAEPQPMVSTRSYTPAILPITNKPTEEKNRQNVQLVQQQQVSDYLLKHAQPEYLQKLPVFQLPILPAGNYRAFEVSDDFAFPGAVLIGKLISNWLDLVDGQQYLLVTSPKGVLYRRIYNQVKIKGVLLLSSDKAGISSFEIPIKEVLEVWEARAFISLQMPEPAISLDRVSQLVTDLQQELERLKQ